MGGICWFYPRIFLCSKRYCFNAYTVMLQINPLPEVPASMWMWVKLLVIPLWSSSLLTYLGNQQYLYYNDWCFNCFWIIYMIDVYMYVHICMCVSKNELLNSIGNLIPISFYYINIPSFTYIFTSRVQESLFLSAHILTIICYYLSFWYKLF